MVNLIVVYVSLMCGSSISNVVYLLTSCLLPVLAVRTKKYGVGVRRSDLHGTFLFISQSSWEIFIHNCISEIKGFTFALFSLVAVEENIAGTWRYIGPTSLSAGIKLDDCRWLVAVSRLCGLAYFKAVFMMFLWHKRENWRNWYLHQPQLVQPKNMVPKKAAVWCQS